MHGPMGGPRRLMEQETSKPKRTGATLARLAQYFRPYTLVLILVAILIIASTWTQVTAPQLIGQAVDCYLMPAASELPSLADGGVPVDDLPAACPQANWDAVWGRMFMDA